MLSAKTLRVGRDFAGKTRLATGYGSILILTWSRQHTKPEPLCVAFFWDGLLDAAVGRRPRSHVGYATWPRSCCSSVADRETGRRRSRLRD